MDKLIMHGVMVADGERISFKTVPIAGWERLPEVAAYAESHRISVPEAVRQLVNCGLSHGVIAVDDDRDSFADSPIADFERFPEVVAYAKSHGISVPEAMRQLVNCGLSHAGE